jgi:hypothetical protein
MGFFCNDCGKQGYNSDVPGAYGPRGWIKSGSWPSYKFYCSNACKRKSEDANSNSSSSPGVNQSQSGNEEAKANAEQAKAQAAEAKSQENASKWNTYAQLGTAAFSAASSTGKEVKETTDYLAKLIFSNDAEELGNQLSEISAMWGGAEKYLIKDNTEAVKKAAFEKFEFGFMKLQQVGMPHQIEFFTKKQKEMKPKRFGFF